MENEIIISEISALKNLLEQSDHVPNKLAEGIVLALDGATAVNAIPRLLAAVVSALDEYRDTIRSRAEWRQRIHDLEAELSGMESSEMEKK